MTTVPEKRLYDDLSWLWPMWGDHEGEYREFCDFVTACFEKYACREIKTVLDMGCGGGKNVVNLARQFAVTGLDLSPSMLALARKLNPGCAFIEADMRDFDLGKRFDAILIDDAVAYMTTGDDLRAVFEAAYRHLAPGGVLAVVPDETTKTFRQNATHIWYSEPRLSPPDTEVAYIVNNYDPDPSDTTYEALMLFLIRERGQLRVEQDRHTLGLFPLELCRSLLRETGFAIHEEAYREETACSGDYTVFACVREP